MRRRVVIIVLMLLILDIVVGVWFYTRWREKKFSAEINAAARRYDVDPQLIRSVVWQESRFDPDARGQAGEIGLMQIMSPAAEDWALAEKIDPWDHEMCADPGTNTLAGAWYLAKLIKRYPQTDDPLVFALADYNAGRTHVLRWAKGPAETNSVAFLEAMTFPGTKKYIESVLAQYRHH